MSQPEEINWNPLIPKKPFQEMTKEEQTIACDILITQEVKNGDWNILFRDIDIYKESHPFQRETDF